MRNRTFPVYTIDSYESFEELLMLVKGKYGNRIAFRTRYRKQEKTYSYERLYGDVSKLAAYCNQTYGTGNKVAILGENSYLWAISYFAIVGSGNVVVPIDKELSAHDIADLLDDCQCDLLIHSAEYADIADELAAIKPSCSFVAMPQLEKQIENMTTGSFAETCPTDIAAIVYTSGTTGKSKGVMLSQKNICADTRAACMFIELYGRSLALLPFHHTFAFTVSVLANIYYGVDTLICHSLKNVMALINDFKPTYLAVVPMIVEKVDKGILAKIEKSGKQNLLSIMDIVCKPFDALNINLRNKCFSAIRNGLGGELDFIICGGAPIDQKIIDRFETYGITILNGYGISECSPVVSVNRRYHHCPDSIGQALPGVQVQIDAPNERAEGEICVKGEIVMQGYYNMPEETAATLTDGWFHTGDLGTIDAEGFIHITGRLKNLIILSNGKNVSPEELENLIARIPGVVEVLVYEEDRQLVAEIFPDQEFQPSSGDMESYLNATIAQLNDSQPPYKAISKVKLRYTEFEKTTTKKIKRTYKAAH